MGSYIWARYPTCRRCLGRPGLYTGKFKATAPQDCIWEGEGGGARGNKVCLFGLESLWWPDGGEDGPADHLLAVVVALQLGQPQLEPLLSLPPETVPGVIVLPWRHRRGDSLTRMMRRVPSSGNQCGNWDESRRVQKKTAQFRHVLINSDRDWSIQTETDQFRQRLINLKSI